LKDTLQGPDLKSSLRKETLAKRDSIPAPVRKVKDSAILERLLALDKFRDAESVLFYASFRSEVNTTNLIKKALDLGKKVLLPRVDEEETALKIYEIKSMDDVAPGYMGIPEPEALEENARGLEGVDLVIMPGAAFDPRGYRLGYGRGYYDMLLSEEVLRPALAALAYEEQVLESVPAEAHDVRVDIIVTDRKIIYCSGRDNGQEEN
jgi:5-formyltetrahydrofolate cyclo-ligase